MCVQRQAYNNAAPTSRRRRTPRRDHRARRGRAAGHQPGHDDADHTADKPAKAVWTVPSNVRAADPSRSTAPARPATARSPAPGRSTTRTPRRSGKPPPAASWSRPSRTRTPNTSASPSRDADGDTNASTNGALVSFSPGASRSHAAARVAPIGRPAPRSAVLVPPSSTTRRPLPRRRARDNPCCRSLPPPTHRRSRPRQRGGTEPLRSVPPPAPPTR